jgi:predicted nuclease with TOPRIM domain
MSDKYQEHKDQQEFIDDMKMGIRSLTIADFRQAYRKLDKVQEFLEGSMSEDNLAVVDMVEEAKSHLDEVGDRIATLHKLICLGRCEFVRGWEGR